MVVNIHYQFRILQNLTDAAFFSKFHTFWCPTGAVGMTYKSLFGETQSVTLRWIFCHGYMLDMTCVTQELT